MHFIPATLEHLDLLNYRDTQQHVIDSDPLSDWHREEELEQNIPGMRQYIAYQDDAPIGFLQILDPQLEPSQYRGTVKKPVRAIDIWIGEAKNIRKGYGTQMMQRAIQQCFTDPEVEEIWIDPLASNSDAHHFYEKMGFVFSHEQWFGPDHCFVYILSRT